MKVALLTFVLGVCALQSINAQCLYSGLPAAPAVVAAPAVITTNNVGATLADTLSLLTVSNLLAEKLPLGPMPILSTIPSLPIAPIAPVVGNCGCGYNGFPYGPYIL